MNPLLEFERREDEIAPDIVGTLRALGDIAIATYASVGIFHNTLSRFVPSILEHGLIADSPEAAPDPADVDFATELFMRKGYRYDASQQQFDILIRGRRGDREPGVFFYPLRDDAIEFRQGYGVPERLNILAMEMGYVMLMEDGPYTDAERLRAREIYQKYRDVILDDENSHIAVIKANPFSPNIINHRLAYVTQAMQSNTPETIVEYMRVSEYREWEGIYIPGSVPAEDLQVMDAQLPILHGLNEQHLNPTNSRYFYTPPNLRRI